MQHAKSHLGVNLDKNELENGLCLFVDTTQELVVNGHKTIIHLQGKIKLEVLCQTERNISDILIQDIFDGFSSENSLLQDTATTDELDGFIMFNPTTTGPEINTAAVVVNTVNLDSSIEDDFLYGFNESPNPLSVIINDDTLDGFLGGLRSIRVAIHTSQLNGFGVENEYVLTN